jgi:hypothetical protein
MASDQDHPDKSRKSDVGQTVGVGPFEFTHKASGSCCCEVRVSR